MLVYPEVSEDINKGEADFRRVLKQSFLNKNYIALHSVGISNHSTKPYSEADFVVITDFGIFCLEVKGGLISRNKGLWKIGYEGNYYESSEGPYKQAAGTVAPILRSLKDNNNQRASKFSINFGVIFPHDEFINFDIESKKEQTCDKTEISNFENFLINLGSFTIDHFRKRGIFVSSQPVTKEDIIWASNVLRNDIALKGFRVFQTEESEQEIIELELSQSNIVDEFFYGNKKRMIISGGAGTGKTIICNKVVSKLSASNLKVLYVCFNNGLAKYLRKILEDLPNLEIYTFPAFMIKITKQSPKKYEDKNFFEDLPKLFEEEILKKMENNSLEIFDCIVIDEAQDIFTKKNIENLFLFLKGGFKNGSWFISIDPLIQADTYSRFDQEVYDQILKTSDSYKRDLFRNLRNPEKIVKQANKIYPELGLPIPTRSITTKPKKFIISVEEEIPMLSKIVKRILDEGAIPEQISILTFNSTIKSVLNTVNTICGKKLINIGKFNEDEDVLVWSEISSFKGLENHFIIVVECPEAELDPRLKSLYYVSLTRAITDYYILCNQNSFLKAM